MSEYATCKHSHDTGGTCNSAAVTGRDYCTHHLRHRARQLRMAQARARNERFDLKLPSIESMSTVLSAVNQLVEAVAADMIDLKRADFLLKTVRFAAQALKSSEKWQPSVFHIDVAAPAINLEAEYGLPNDLDLNLSPEVAFPSTPAASETDNWPPATDNWSDLSPMPVVGYCAEHGRDCPDLAIRADHPVTPEAVELYEIFQTQGNDAGAHRAAQLQKNRHRRNIRTEGKRYAAIALERNLRLAAEKLAQRKLATEKAAQQSDQPEIRKQPASVAPTEAQTNAAQSIA